MPSITTPIPSENCRSVESVDFARPAEAGLANHVPTLSRILDSAKQNRDNPPFQRCYKALLAKPLNPCLLHV